MGRVGALRDLLLLGYEVKMSKLSKLLLTEGQEKKKPWLHLVSRFYFQGEPEIRINIHAVYLTSPLLLK